MQYMIRCLFCSRLHLEIKVSLIRHVILVTLLFLLHVNADIDATHFQIMLNLYRLKEVES